MYLDRLLHFVSFYLFKLLAAPGGPKPHLVFSGGIGERSARLRADVVRRLAFLGVELDDGANGGKVDGVLHIGGGGSVDGVWVVETDEEGECAKMAVRPPPPPLFVPRLRIAPGALTFSCLPFLWPSQRAALKI